MTKLVAFMRSVMIGGAALVLATGLVTAQESKPKAKKVTGTITLADTVKIGDKVLRPGEYKVTTNGETIVFSESTNRDHDAVTLTFPAKGTDLKTPSTQTQANTSTDASGAKVLQSLVLKGSAMQFTFENTVAVVQSGKH